MVKYKNKLCISEESLNRGKSTQIVWCLAIYAIVIKSGDEFASRMTQHRTITKPDKSRERKDLTFLNVTP